MITFNKDQLGRIISMIEVFLCFFWKFQSVFVLKIAVCYEEKEHESKDADKYGHIMGHHAGQRG